MSPEQCRMARAALKWSTEKLARASGLDKTTVNRFENGKVSYTSTATKLQTTFEAEGLAFIAANGGGPGVRLNGKAQSDD